MLDGLDGSGRAAGADDAFDLLQDLEKNRTDEVRRQRTHFRLAIKSGVVVQPGNASEMLKFKVKGVTGDISEGGCSVLVPIPIHVGDIFRLNFDRSQLDLPMTFARCLRCRLVREDAFEVGFVFFKPITLPNQCVAAAAPGSAS